MVWPFEDARDNLDDLLDQVERDGPQKVQYGDKRVVFITEKDFRLIEGLDAAPGHTREDVQGEGNDVESR